MEEIANIESKSSGSKNKNEESSRSKYCRICYEGDHEYNELIHPCKCTGSVRFVHEECLKT